MKEDSQTSPVFGKVYADDYDLFYREKDYEAECDMIEGILQHYGQGPTKTILDLGCGTGNHALPLARRGYQVTGVDSSEEMLRQARQKTLSAVNPSFLREDLRTLYLERSFDTALMMFAVLGYQSTNDDVLSALRSVRRHLTSGGLFIFDVWYGPAVLAIRPDDKVKEIPTRDGKIVRTASGSLDTSRHIATVSYKIQELKQGQIVRETSETHHMRFFFPQELAFFLSVADLDLLELRAFVGQKETASESTWNVLAVARVNEGSKKFHNEILTPS